MPAEDLTLIANFEMTGYIFTLVANPEEGGTVIGSGTYIVGFIFIKSSSPNPGWDLFIWTFSLGNLISNQPAKRIPMPAEDLTLKSKF